MTRCNSCNGIITKTDSECFTCGEPVPGLPKPVWYQIKKSKPRTPAPATPVTNLLFMASLVLTGVSFLSSQKLTLPVSAALSGVLLVARIVMDRKAAPSPQSSEGASLRSSQLPPELLRRITLG